MTLRSLAWYGILLLVCARNVISADDVAKPYQVKMATTKGPVVIEVHPEWAPLAAARFKELVESKFFDNARFYHFVDGSRVEFGLPTDPQLGKAWSQKPLIDESAQQLNTKGMLSFCPGKGADSRATRLIINLGNNPEFDKAGYVPFAKVVKGLNSFDFFYKTYADGPDVNLIQEQGNVYLEEAFPKLDFIRSMTISQ